MGYEKAFDSLDHQSLFHALKTQVNYRKYIRLIKAIYTEPSARIHLESTTTDAFKIKESGKATQNLPNFSQQPWRMPSSPWTGIRMELM